jgi:broad specificity phosphatase PhoE
VPKQQVVVVRHGETEWSKDGRHTGKSDIPLTEHGRQEARRLRPELTGWQFKLVLVSPLQRAVETCRLAGYGDQAQLRPDLEEWDYGSYDGKTSEQIREQNPSWSLWDDGGPGGEKPADVGRRVDRVIGEVRRTEGDVLLVAHGHILRVLAARWLGQAPGDGRHYALQTAALGILGYERETPVIDRWNQPPPG